jgi:ArpU family phage transcriptional regulator
MTDMPKSPGFNNRSEDAIVQYMYAEEERDEIMRAITSLNSTNKQILYLCFCHQERFNNRNIADELGYSIRSIEDKKAEALIEFAEAYRQGALRVYTKNWQEK